MKYRSIQVTTVVMLVLAGLLILQPDRWSMSAQANDQQIQFEQRPPDNPSQPAQTATVPYTTCVAATFGDPATLDPALDYETSGAQVLRQIYEPLLAYNHNKVDEYIPMLATTWSVSPDAQTYTFTIRPEVRFHNGAALTPEDVAFSFWRGIVMGDPNTPQFLVTEALFNIDDVTQLVAPDGSLVGDPAALRLQSPAVLQAACQTIKTAITFDDAAGTVSFHLVHPWGPFLDTIVQPWGSVLDKDWVTSRGDWDGNCTTWQNYYGVSTQTSPIASITNGTGPFMLEHWITNTEVSLVRNPAYWRQAPIWSGGPGGLANLERVVIKNIPNFATRYTMLMTGQADEITPGAAADRAQLEDQVLLRYDVQSPISGTLDYLTGTLTAYSGLLNPSATDFLFTYNAASSTRNYFGSGTFDGNGAPPDFFSDIHVRKAFNYSFDWTQYINDIYGSPSGTAIQRTGPIIKGILGYTDTQPAYFYSPTLAMQEFSQAWGGQVLSQGFAITLSYNTDNYSRQRLAEIVKTGLEGLTTTFHVNVVELPWPDYLSDLRARMLPLSTGGWQQDIPHPHNWVVPYLSGTYASRASLPADQRTIFQTKIDNCVTLTGGAAGTCYEDIQNTAYLSATYIFLAQAVDSKYFSATVRGYIANLGYGYQPYYYLLSKGPMPVIQSVLPNASQTVGFTSTAGATATLEIPTGAVTQTMDIAIVPDTVATDLPDSFQFGNLAFDFQVYISNTLVPHQTFNSPITLTLHYSDQTRGTLIEDQLMLFWWNGNAWEDAACGSYVRDLANHVLQVPICHFSQFALGGVTHSIYLPLALHNS